MSTSSLFPLILLTILVIFPLMCYAHRNLGSALLATLFAPLVFVPMGAILFFVTGVALTALCNFLEHGGILIANSTIHGISWIVTGSAVIVALIVYASGQRHLSAIKTGPRWGGARVDPNPTLNQRRALR
ncbi:MAG: hypothetical protein AAGA96_08485 [Verrucomicrobiota bacterium]